MLNHTPTNSNTTTTTPLPSSSSSTTRLFNTLRSAFPDFSVLVGDELHRPLSATHTFTNKNTSHINSNSSSNNNNCICCIHSDHVTGNVGLIGGNVSGLGK